VENVTRRVGTAVAVVFALFAAACGGGGGPDRALSRSSSTTATTAVPTTTAAPTSTTEVPTTTAVPAVAWPALAADGAAGAVVTPTGVVVPVLRTEGERFVVQAPCGGETTVAGSPIDAAHVVIDPGHGGDEPGAIGPNALTEKEVNLAVAEEAKAILEASGATVVLTRTSDYRIALRTRGRIATQLAPVAFVSVHHNAEPDGPWPGPGSETYYQSADADSKRLAGLAWEELVAALSAFPAAWVADSDAGAKYRLAGDGGDYYGILRRTAGTPAVLSEAAFISSAPEAALLATPAFRSAEAAALARAVIRFVATTDPGSGYVEPYPRTTPAGPGGGVEGCVDPPLE
jgi:N-acetylmuramoyl-L-alanine amidase